jgi:glyoxylase I family protein
MILNKIHHIAIICSNYERSKYFYTNILELKIVKETYRQERNSYKLDLAIGNNCQIELFSFQKAPKRLSYPEGCGLRHLAFEVDNIEGVVEKLKFKGIEVEKIRIDEITGKKFTFFEDPDELPIEIYEK